MTTIIFLNGASSAGKTSLGKALQNVLDQPYFLLVETTSKTPISCAQSIANEIKARRSP